MSAQHPKPQATIRTFAKDLAIARGNRSQVTADDSSAEQDTPDKKTPAVPQENFKAQAPRPTTHVEAKKIPAPKKEATQKSSGRFQSKIPAFHELKQKVNKEIEENVKSVEKKPQQNPVAPKIEVNKKSKKPDRTNIGYDAAVITDTKDERFNLFSAIKDSLTSWFKNFSFSKKKKAPIYTVPDTQRRKGIIQRATSKSGSIFTADSAELRAKIKQRQKQVGTSRRDQIIEEGELSWSPYTDTGFNLLESPEDVPEVTGPQSVAVEYKKQIQSSDVPLPPKPKQSIPSVPPAPAVEEPAEKAPAEADTSSQPISSRWEAASEQKVPSAKAESAEPAPTPNISVDPIKTPQPNTPDREEDESSDSTEFSLVTLNTNTLAISIVAGLSTVVVVFFAGKALIEHFAPESTVRTDNTSYLQAATPNQVTVTNLDSITDMPLQAGSLLEIDYVDTQLFLPNGELVSPVSIISALEFTVLPSFAQSLTDVRFAQLNNSAPIIIFEFTDTETALGGFLSWEESMAQDLRELYLIAQLDNVTFTDDHVRDIDVRVLTSSSGQVLAVYGIVSDNTAIITGSMETFIQVVNASFGN